jgi:hypothetical protein
VNHSFAEGIRTLLHVRHEVAEDLNEAQ